MAKNVCEKCDVYFCARIRSFNVNSSSVCVCACARVEENRIRKEFTKE